ncbi:unnamed protein product [Amaranthus hypochondriacus]
MEWNYNNNKILRNNPSFASHPLAEISSSILHCHSNNLFDHHFPGLEAIKQHGMPLEMRASSCNNSNHEEIKIKRRLTTNQIELLENSFEEEKKLDPDRKMKLARELGLHHRQVAVWFQNRRARWKAKKLQHLYDALKLQFDVVSKQNHKLQQEVERLKCMVMEQHTRKQGCNSNTEGSCEETVESTSAPATQFSDHNKPNFSTLSHDYNYNYNYNVVSPSYWGPLSHENYLMSLD